MTSKIDISVVDRAVNALFKYEEKKTAEKTQLIAGFAKPILVQVQLTKEIAQSVLKPVRVKIPHSTFSPDEEEHSVCLFCRSEDKDAIVKHIEGHPLNGFNTVISINDVKKYFKDHKDRKKLLSEHTHFVADARIIRHLYNLLGETFGSRSNLPAPVNIENVDKLIPAVQKSVDSAYFAMKGKCITLRLGHTSMTQKHVVDNIREGLDFAVSKLKGEWKDVHNIHIKTSDSPALPVYSKLPDEMAQFVAKKVAATAAPPAATDKKGKKSTAAAAPAVVPPPAPEKTPAKSSAPSKKSKAPEPEPEPVLPAATPAAKGKTTKKSAAKEEPAPAPVVEEEKPAAPAAAKKGTKRAAAAAAPVEEEEEEEEKPAAKTSRKKTVAATAPVEEPVVEVKTSGRAKRGAAAPAVEQEEPARPKRKAAAKK